MIKKFLFFLALGITSFSTYAQSSDWNFGLSMGSSIPIGNYNSSDISQDKSGYAETGFFLDVSAFYEVNSSFSWVGKLRFNSNPIDNRSVYERAVAQSYPPMGLDLEDSETTFNMNDWLSGALLGGAQYRWNIYDTYFDVYAMIGLQIWFLPDYEMSNPNVPGKPGMTYVESSEKDQTVGFASLLGVAYNVPLKNNVMLRINCDWSGSNVQSSYSQNYVPNEITPASPVVQVGEQEYSAFNSSVNVGIGLVYLF
ncbi:outer membrane beta-barrel protein [Halosquirtibacter laminarini]|uniref:Outer membrane beta-barrel protein n=1 Tax=Halosquirtibacter laminarini TaxID=3374600 RepID=A0AC61NB80_9BACT|nr:outer membrane beta-barrel protein [Prolixibacteraceae bacterium]